MSKQYKRRAAISTAAIKNAVTNAKGITNNGLQDAIFGFNPSARGTAQLSQVDTTFINLRYYFISNMRQPLNQAYCELGIVKTVVDVPVDDALRGGIDIRSNQLSADELDKLQFVMEEKNDIGKMAETMKWDRLFGGAGLIIVTGDEDLAEPLHLESIQQGDPVEFRAADMWELFYDQQNIPEGVGTQDEDFDYFRYYGLNLNKSRVLVTKGIRAPSFVRPRLRGWGLSVVETLIRSINQYLKATDLTFEVLDEFKVDVYKIKGLTNTLLTPDGTNTVRKRIQLANQQKNYQHAISMDAEDDFIQKELSFAGISETMAGIRMQVASDLRMPMSKIFGIASSGFSSGEDDIENYNSMIESTIRQPCKFHMLKLVKIRCQQLFGYVPSDLAIEFKPLRILSAEQEENVKTQQFNRLIAAKQAGSLTELEFRESLNKDKLLPMQLDTSDEVLGEIESNQEQKQQEKTEGEKSPKDKAPKSKLTSKEADA